MAFHVLRDRLAASLGKGGDDISIDVCGDKGDDTARCLYRAPVIFRELPEPPDVGGDVARYTADDVRWSLPYQGAIAKDQKGCCRGWNLATTRLLWFHDWVASLMDQWA